MSQRRATSMDIAYRAGVSQSTVSRALRDSPLVTPETRAKIKEIARELNYRVDRHAASLRSQASHTLALLIFEDPTSDDSHINPFFMSMLSNITRCAGRKGYDLLVSFQQMDEDWHTEYEVSSRADGLILLGYGNYTVYQSKLTKLEEAGAHFIIWGPMNENQPGISVGSDNFRGGYDVTQHLISLGHRRIAFLGGADESCPEFLLRYRGHCKALEEAGITPDPALQIDAENIEDHGEEAARQLLKKKADFTAAFCASDLIAIGAMREFNSRGLRVPEDVSVAGFDNIPAASYTSPPLTTVNQDTARAAELLVQKMLDLIQDLPQSSELVTPALIVRKSTAPAPSGE